jgi:site-specific DNA recombinase
MRDRPSALSTKKQYVAFARVSSREQEREGFSLEVQEDALKKYAEKTGGSIVRLFKVAETASKKNERKTFKEMLAFAKDNAGKIAGVLFYKIDRAARNLFDYVELERLESDHGVPFISVSQPMESNPAGKMMRRTLASIASFYTDQQSLDVREGHERRIKDGWFVSRAPYGYRNRRVNGRGIVEIDPIPAANVRKMFELFAWGSHTLDSLCATLKAEGLKFRANLPEFPRGSVHNILLDRAYIGDLEFRGQWYKGAHEPLVDRQTWDRVQKILGQKVYRHAELTYAGGLIKCGHCGALVSGESVIKKKTGKQYVYYRCAQYNYPGHPRHRVTEADLDRQIIEAFASMKQDKETAAWFVEVIKARGQDAVKQDEKKIAELNRQMTAIRKQQDELLNMRIEGDIDQDTFAAKSTQLRDRLAELDVDVVACDRSRSENADQAVKVFELSQSLQEKWLAADYAQKRQILSIVFLNFTLSDVSLVYEMRKPFALLREGLLVSSNRDDRI